METILLTGGGGYIGSHICILLLEKGYRVKILDSFINSNPDVITKIKKIFLINNKDYHGNFEIFKGDILDKDYVENIFYKAKNEKKPIDSVIHLAGLKSVAESVLDPLSYWDVNVKGTINLLKVMKKFDCPNLIFSSSASIYGNSTKEIVDENSLIMPISPYAFTKASIENILTNLYNSNPNFWKFLSLRYFNPVGAHNSGLIGENPNGDPTNLFPIMGQVALGLKQKLNVFGKDWDTFDGTCIRDYIHVMDLANAHCESIEYLENNQPAIKFLNIGTGIGTSVLEAINCFIKVNNIDLKYQFTKRRNGDVGVLIADNKLGLNELNWAPKENLESMCRDAWRYQKNNLKLKWD